MAGEFAADFDGSSDYIQVGTLTGNTNGKLGIMSFWLKYPTVSASKYFLGSTLGHFRILTVASNGILYFYGYDAGGTLRMNLNCTSEYDDDTWHHFLVSWDTASAAHWYVDDVDSLTQSTLVSADLDYTNANTALFASVDGGNKFTGTLSEFYWAQEYLDFSVEANRRKFIGADGKPAGLGADGSGPTGTAALVYAPDGNPTVNQGTGGNFTEYGAPVRIAGPNAKKRNRAMWARR